MDFCRANYLVWDICASLSCAGDCAGDVKYACTAAVVSGISQPSLLNIPFGAMS